MSHDLHTRLRNLAGDDHVRRSALATLLDLLARVPFDQVTAEDLGAAYVALDRLAELNGVSLRDFDKQRQISIDRLEHHARTMEKVHKARTKPHRFEGLAKNRRATLQITQAADKRELRLEVDGDDLVLYSTDVAAVDVLAAWDGSSYEETPD